MNFMGVRQGYNFQEDDEHHQQMNMVNVMLPFSSSNNTSASSPSSSSASPNCSRGPVPLTTADGGRCWDSRINNCEKLQPQHFPWVWPAAEKRGDEEVETGEEEISGGRWIRINNEGAAAAAAAVRSRGAVDSSSEEGTPMMVAASVEREHMFDKVVTPSDVGKLNRLVIPKQHAEKYFPLDSSTNEKGLLLNFEDRSGKPWRFRYSYWNSSQSYVMTKGWSRFVKEKRLDAGDIVSFHRGVGEAGKDRLYIDWRRRPDEPTPYNAAAAPFFSSLPPHPLACLRRPSPSTPSQPPWTPLFWGPPSTAATGPWDHHAQQQVQASDRSGSMLMSAGSGLHHSYDQILGHHHHHHQQQQLLLHRNSSYGSGSYGYDNVAMSPFIHHQLMRSNSTTTLQQQQEQHRQQQQQQREVDIGAGAGAGAGNIGCRVHQVVQERDQGVADPMVLESVPVVVPGKASSALKRLRLFGVNMECPIPQPDISSSSISHLRPLHLSLYHGTPLLNKDKASASSSSLDFEMLN